MQGAFLLVCSVDLGRNPCEAALRAAGLQMDRLGQYSGAQVRDYNKVCVYVCLSVWTVRGI